MFRTRRRFHFTSQHAGRSNETITTMKISRLATAILFCSTLSAGAHAQTINRANVPAGYATPTGGSFSIRFPIPFADLVENGDSFGAGPNIVVRMVTGITNSGIRLSAAEMPDPNSQL